MEDSIDKLEDYLYIIDEQGFKKKRNFGPEWNRLDQLRKQLDGYYKLRVFAFNGCKLYIKIYTYMYVYLCIYTYMYVYILIQYFSSLRLSMHILCFGENIG